MGIIGTGKKSFCWFKFYWHCCEEGNHENGNIRWNYGIWRSRNSGKTWNWSPRPLSRRQSCFCFCWLKWVVFVIIILRLDMAWTGLHLRENHIQLLFQTSHPSRFGSIDSLNHAAGKHISVMMCSPSQETHIPSDMCSPTQETHITRNMCSPTQETSITSDMCSAT